MNYHECVENAAGDCIAPSQVFLCSCSNKSVVPNFTHLNSSGAAGHASQPPLNQIRLSNMLLEYLMPPAPPTCQCDLQLHCLENFFGYVCSFGKDSAHIFHKENIKGNITLLSLLTNSSLFFTEKIYKSLIADCFLSFLSICSFFSSEVKATQYEHLAS